MRTVRFLTKCFSAPNHPTDGEHPKNAPNLNSRFLLFISYINSLFQKVNTAFFSIKLEIKINPYSLDKVVYSLDNVVYYLNKVVYLLKKLVYCLNKVVYSLNINLYSLNKDVYFLKKLVFCLDKVVYSLNNHLYSSKKLLFSAISTTNTLVYKLISSNPLKQKVKEKLSF